MVAILTYKPWKNCCGFSFFFFFLVLQLRSQVGIFSPSGVSYNSHKEGEGRCFLPDFLHLSKSAPSAVKVK